jgi:hypothetical protein
VQRGKSAAAPAQAQRGGDGRGLTRYDDAGWEAQLAKLRKYRRKHGGCNVPRGWTEDPGLGSWVKNQRARKKKLDRGQPSKGMTAARAAKLDVLGFAWALSAAAVISKQRSATSQNDAGWEVQLAKLKVYTREHGDCNVPQGWAEDPPLGQWVHRQRARKKALDRGEPSEGMTAARAAKLEALGFAWELSAEAIRRRGDARWEVQLAKLKVYTRKHGDCNVPHCWAEDPPLGRWVSKQRKLKKALDRGEPSEGMMAARAAELDALGFAWALPRGRAAQRGCAHALKSLEEQARPRRALPGSAGGSRRACLACGTTRAICNR